MTQEEKQRVGLSAKRLLKRLVEEFPKLLLQDWFKDRPATPSTPPTGWR